MKNIMKMPDILHFHFSLNKLKGNPDKTEVLQDGYSVNLRDGVQSVLKQIRIVLIGLAAFVWLPSAKLDRGGRMHAADGLHF